MGGLTSLVLVEGALVATGNPNYVPSVIVPGVFLVPVTLVSYLYVRLLVLLHRPAGTPNSYVSPWLKYLARSSKPASATARLKSSSGDLNTS